MGQALTNVLKNAVEAINARMARRQPIAARSVSESTADRAGDSRLRVIDNGTGLPDAARERLTEPYVTTRAKGTGLGLAIVKKILEDHGGALTLEDAPADEDTGKGAMITLHFPCGLRSMRFPTTRPQRRGITPDGR